MTKQLYLENGEKASLKDVCNWWIETYPSDVFVNNPKPVVEARICMQNILIMTHNKMKKYYVYFEQINQDVIEVEAGNEGEARMKARHEWMKGWMPIKIIDVVEFD